MIKNIIFDLGNVLLNLAESDNYKALEHLLEPTKCLDIDEMVFFPFERGEISEESFFNRLQRRSKIVKQGEIYYQAWNAMLLDFPAKRIELLKSLKDTYRVFLLSNTNITHIRTVKKDLEKSYGIVDFEKLFFEKVYLSYELGLRKPDSEIYQFVLEDSGLKAEESIFIDDNLENVKGAKKVGLNVHHHNPDQEIVEVIYKLLG